MALPIDAVHASAEIASPVERIGNTSQDGTGMAGNAPQIDWYLARDGQQHGPLTEAEMRKFVELGHMRPTDLVWRSGFPDWRPAATVFPNTGRSPPPAARQPQMERQAARGNGVRVAAPDHREHIRGAHRPRKRRGRAVLMMLILLAALGGAGWAGWQYRDQLLSFAFIKDILSWSANSFPSSAERFRTSPFAAAGETAESIDANLQRAELWVLLKQEFPDWYQQRVKDIERLRSEKKDDAAIGKALAEAVVALRRKDGNSAYAAPPEALRRIATSFLDTLNQLSGTDELCFGFVAQGETYAAGTNNLTAQQMEPLHRQIAAVFAAIVEGRKSPRPVERGRKEDYDALTTELSGRGWSDEDLQTFSDQRLLAKASPKQVCRLVREWIAAQVNLKNDEAQVRLLTDSLRPLISG